jgi:hypothetical protein
MVEIELSTFPDSEVDVRTLVTLLEEFRAKTGVKVQVREVTSGNASLLSAINRTIASYQPDR